MLTESWKLKFIDLGHNFTYVKIHQCTKPRSVYFFPWSFSINKTLWSAIYNLFLGDSKKGKMKSTRNWLEMLGGVCSGLGEV